MGHVIIIQKMHEMRQAIKAALLAEDPGVDVTLPKDEVEAERQIKLLAAQDVKLLVITGFQRWNVRYGEDVVRCLQEHAADATVLICSGSSLQTFAHLRPMIDGVISRNPVAVEKVVRFWARVQDIHEFADSIPGLTMFSDESEDSDEEAEEEQSDEDPSSAAQSAAASA